MHGALADGDVDVVVGDDAGEALGDAVQFYGGGRAGRVDDALSLAERSGGREAESRDAGMRECGDAERGETIVLRERLRA
ncbi:hypothetical protein GCM10010446_00450 [Streptomyces enissocaesilis]|uniref:Uncharacterized protein n=1 Tax=Streptomyces enissocaesilis TaxID=332589 RepID=A0ABP6J456_9ACTN